MDDRHSSGASSPDQKLAFNSKHEIILYRTFSGIVMILPGLFQTFDTSYLPQLLFFSFSSFPPVIA
jgi:hypothetical protein